jgi:hypothetical protein
LEKAGLEMNAAAALLLVILLIFGSATGTVAPREYTCYESNDSECSSIFDEKIPENKDTGREAELSAFVRFHFHIPFIGHHKTCSPINAGTHQANRLFIVLKTIRR